MFADPVVVTLAGLGVVLELAFVVLLPLELVGLWRRRALTRARAKEMLGNLGPFALLALTEGAAVAWVTLVYVAVAVAIPWSIPTDVGTAVAAVVLVDFVYYWDHRLGHRVRALWAASHAVHHGSPVYDQTVGFRISFVDGFLTPLWYLPLVLAGFAPGLVAAALLVVIGYQQWIHTELVGRLRWLDPWLNTPSNHRVHHASQGPYLDRNYGGILIVWDRLFGTYAPEVEAPRYGLTVPVGSVHPWPVHVAELRRLVRALRATPRWRERWAILWRGPEWIAPSTTAVDR
jgi:sterol desaturase/sphingolipid hydroxylase (fatty acid hydroxylase superfamily)